MPWKIESGVLIPQTQKKLIHWPLRDLKVGECFYCDNQRLKHQAACAAWRIAKATGMKFTVRDVESQPGFRVWRTL